MINKIVLERDTTAGGNCTFYVEIDETGGFYLHSTFDDSSYSEDAIQFDHKEAKSLYEFLKSRFDKPE